MGFAFHFEVVIGAGKPDDAASADAEPNQAVTAQRVNVPTPRGYDRADFLDAWGRYLPPPPAQ